jgi:hypothetical protein
MYKPSKRKYSYDWYDEDYDNIYSTGTYSWQPSKWSNYSFNSYSFDTDDNSKLFVKDPLTYITPTNSDIKSKTSVWIQKSLDTIKELSRVCYFKMIDEKDYVSDQFKDIDSLPDSEQVEVHKKKELYDSIFEQFIPGNTPLEQAIAIYRQISNTTEYAVRGKRNEEIDFDSTLSFDRAVYTDADINEQLDFNEISKQRKMDILDKISIVGQLGDQFKVEKEISEKIVSNSNQYAKKIMRDYAQFSNIELYQKMFPNFFTKFLTKDLTVNIPIDRKEQKQKIIILLDFSGSMDQPEKQIWVNAIMIDRLRYVMKEEAEVFFSYFVHNPDKLNFVHLKNRDDVMSFWKWFSNSPNGGTTNIGGMVTRIAEEIDRKKLCNLDIDLSVERPEILVINDGEDRVGYDTLPYKVNAISLMDFSEELKKLCIGTGGKQVRVQYNGSVKSYADEGVTILKEPTNKKSESL